MFLLSANLRLPSLIILAALGVALAIFVVPPSELPNRLAILESEVPGEAVRNLQFAPFSFSAFLGVLF